MFGDIGGLNALFFCKVLQASFGSTEIIKILPRMANCGWVSLKVRVWKMVFQLLPRAQSNPRVSTSVPNTSWGKESAEDFLAGGGGVFPGSQRSMSW